jgi:hypothetical protein
MATTNFNFLHLPSLCGWQVLVLLTIKGGGGGLELVPTTVKKAWFSLRIPVPWAQSL